MRLTRPQADQIVAAVTTEEGRFANWLCVREKARDLSQSDPIEHARFILDAKAALASVRSGEMTTAEKFVPAPVVKR